MTAAVVLAGGTSRRFGADKLAALLGDGRSVLAHAVEAAAAVTDELVVVLAPGAKRPAGLPARARVVNDHAPAAALPAGLREGEATLVVGRHSGARADRTHPGLGAWPGAGAGAGRAGVRTGKRQRDGRAFGRVVERQGDLGLDVGVLLGGRSGPAALILAAVAIVAEAASGHAASSVLPAVAIPSLAIHLSAVGIWIYAIGGSLLAAPSVRRALGMFTPYAVTAAVLTAGTGLVNAVLELADPADVELRARRIVESLALCLEGSLLVTPAPSAHHQIVATRLVTILICVHRGGF